MIKQSTIDTYCDFEIGKNKQLLTKHEQFKHTILEMLLGCEYFHVIEIENLKDLL